MNKTIALVTLLISYCTFAQQFPVTVSVLVQSPPPIYVYNYADAASINSPLKAQLLLNDIAVSREVRLKISVQGNGLNFESNDVIIGGKPIFIDGGIPITLTNVDLAPYFELQNIRGLTPNAYGASLPEGAYQFCLEVFDVITGNRLSLKSCGSTFIFKNDPPLLNQPLDDSNIVSRATENIVFQWTPRHVNVTNVEYELRIVEVWDDTVDPRTSFLSLPPVFTATTRANSFVYGPAQPLLLKNKRYAWQIKAKAIQGGGEVGLFRNQGESEIYSFTLTEPCDRLTNIYAEPKGVSKVNIFWDQDPFLYQSYTIAYREANKPEAEWFTKTTNSTWMTLWDLKSGTTYEYKVKGSCPYVISNFSLVKEVTTDVLENIEANYNCGIVPDEVAITNQEPVQNLNPGNRITAGDFSIVITEIESLNNGRVTGVGYVGIPYLKNAQFGVKFENILVNTNYQLAQGEIVTGADTFLRNPDTHQVDVTINPSETIYGDSGTVHREEVAIVIEDVDINEDGAVVVTGINGEELIFPGGRDMVIVDEEGNVRTVSEDGTISNGSLAEGGATDAGNTSGIEGSNVLQITAEGVLVTFEPSGFYAFDEQSASTTAALKEIYTTIPIKTGGTYSIANKAISDLTSTTQDVILAKATFTDNTISKEDIIFKTKEGVKIDAVWNGNTASLTLKQKFDYAKEEILAVVKPKNDSKKYTVAGVFSLVHLSSSNVNTINVVVVPINGASVPSTIADELNEIYNKVGVNFKVNMTTSLDLPKDLLNQDQALEVGDSSILANYTNDETIIIDYFKSQDDYQKDSYYIFVSDWATTDPTLKGYMPLKRQFGFVFQKDQIERTIAHELGHGVFGLEHPFKEYNTPKSATNLLMDYGNEYHFNHKDWEQIHAPGLKLYLFQSDEDGALSGGNKLDDNTRMKKVLEHFKINFSEAKDVLQWRELIRKNLGGRNGTGYNLKTKKYAFTDLGEDILKFKLLSHPDAVEEIEIAQLDPKIKIEKVGVAGLKIGPRYNVIYKLVLTDKAGVNKFEFEFDHYDDVAAFYNYVNGTKNGFIDSKISHSIINYLNNSIFPEGGLDTSNDCNDIDVYFAEMPSEAIALFFTYDQLKDSLKALLGCFVTSTGANEEKAVLTILEALANRNADEFLADIKTDKVNDKTLFELLYKKIDNWGGEDNFSKLALLLYDIWKKSAYIQAPAEEVAYKNKKFLGFHTSSYSLYFDKAYSKIKIYKTEVNSESVSGSSSSSSSSSSSGSSGFSSSSINSSSSNGSSYNSGSGGFENPESVNTELLATYDLFDPIILVNYDTISFVDSSLNKKGSVIPVFLLKAITTLQKTENIELGAALAFDVATTATGVGNIAKLRHLSHLRKLNKLEKTMATFEKTEASLSVVNLLLKYGCQTDEFEETYACDKRLLSYLDTYEKVLGLGLSADNIINANRKLLDEIDDNPTQFNFSEEELDLIRRGLRNSLNNRTEISDYAALKKSLGNNNTVKLTIEGVTLSLNTLDLFLKFCESEECKEIKTYLEYINNAIKGSKLSIATYKLYARAARAELIDPIDNSPTPNQPQPSNNQGTSKPKPTIAEQESMVREIDKSILKTSVDRASYLKEKLDHSITKNPEMKRLFDNASPTKRTQLEKAFEILDDFPRTQNTPKFLEILVQVNHRFSYNNNAGLDGIDELFNVGSAASKKKIIRGLAQVDEIFSTDLNLPVAFTAIKTGEVKIMSRDTPNKEIARIIDGRLEIGNNLLDKGTVKGTYERYEILENNGKIGFREIQ